MWVCEKCGRTFKRTNQGHYCGKAPESVDAYIALQASQTQAHVTELRRIIQRCVPDAAERIAWSMPMYQKDGQSISFAACKAHISLYVGMDVLERLKPQLCQFTIRKNAVYLLYDRPLPADVIEAIVTESFEAR